MRKNTIAIDFDGTIVEDGYPHIGKPKKRVFEVLIRLQNEGFRLLLWTYRHGKALEEAVKFCKEHGVEFYAVNKNFPEEEYDTSVPRKLLADIYIDDRDIRGMMEWEEIYQILTNDYLPKKSRRFRIFPW
jgi:hydroxymethylpyrimidine pyrophosphatase-like HAD family hydrolase